MLAGENLARGVLGVLSWNSSNGCSSPGCLLLQGGMQALGALEGDLKSCETDLDYAWSNLSQAFDDLGAHRYFSSAAEGVLKNDTVLWSDAAPTRGPRRAPAQGVISDLLSEKNCARFLDVDACDVSARTLRHQREFQRIWRARHNATMSSRDLDAYARAVGWPSWDDLVNDFTQLVAHVEEDADRLWADLVDDLDHLVGDPDKAQRAQRHDQQGGRHADLPAGDGDKAPNV